MLQAKFPYNMFIGSGEEGFLPYMGMAAIIVMWTGLFINALVPPSYRCFLLNLTLIGQAVSEKIFEYYYNIRVKCFKPFAHFLQVLTIFSIQRHGRPMLTLPHK